MVIHNASFMILREQEAEFIDWLSRELEHSVDYCETPGPRNPRISAMREASGVDYSEAEAQTVAFQVEFDNTDAARAWNRSTFADLAGRFERRYAPNALVFTSLFETI